MGNLRYQFTSSIDNAVALGLNKHSYKKQGCSTQKIPSYQYRKNLINFANNLVNFLIDNYPEIKKLKDIKSEHIEAFFIAKEKCCSHRTLVQYRSYIRVLDRCIAQNLHFKVHLINGVPKNLEGGEKIRTIFMTREHANLLLESIKGSKSKCVLGVQIAILFGLRASEVVHLKAKDFRIETGILFIHKAKGGKNRYLEIDTFEKIELSRKIRNSFEDEKILVPVRADTFDRFINYHLVKLGLTEYREGKTSCHSIRKMVADEMTKEGIKEGLTEKESLLRTSKFLGHNREEVVKSAYTKGE